MSVTFVPRDGHAIVNTADLPAVIASNPNLKTIQYNGHTLAVLPHTLEACQAYTLAGLDLAGPIYHEYHWPRIKGIYPPKSHQFVTTDFLTRNSWSFCLNEIGTGKTYSVLWALDYLMRTGKVRRALIASPLSTLKQVWFDSIYNTFRDRTAVILHHSDSKKRRELLKKDYDFYIVNHDGLQVLSDLTYDKRGVLLRSKFPRDDIDAIVIDEVAVYRNAQTNKWHVLNKLIESVRPAYCWGLTGTPTPNKPTDAWAQVKLLAPNNVPRYYSVFERTVMFQVSQFKWESLPDAMDKVYAVMRPAIRFSRDECLELPDVIYLERECEPSPAQRKAYKDMVKSLSTELESGAVITAVNEGVKLGKLLQIMGGVAYDDGGVPSILDAKSRLSVLSELCDEAGGKVIVFVPYRAILESVASHLRAHNRHVEIIHGGVPVRQRDRIFADFQNRRYPDTLVADAGCMSHGLTLVQASTIIWYGPEVSNEVYEQANGRITREGQVHKAVIIHLYSSPIERQVFERVKEKGRLQGLLLKLIQESRGL